MMDTFVGKICRVTDVAYKCGCWIVPFLATCELRISVFLKDLKAKILWLPWDDLIFGCIERQVALAEKKNTQNSVDIPPAAIGSCDVKPVLVIRRHVFFLISKISNGKQARAGIEELNFNSISRMDLSKSCEPFAVLKNLLKEYSR